MTTDQPRQISGRVGRYNVTIDWLPARRWLRAGYSIVTTLGPTLAPLVTGGIVAPDGSGHRLTLRQLVAAALAPRPAAGEPASGPDVAGIAASLLATLLERLPSVSPSYLAELSDEIVVGQTTLEPIDGGKPVRLSTPEVVDAVLVQPWDLVGIVTLALRQFDPTSPGGPIGQGTPGNNAVHGSTP